MNDKPRTPCRFAVPVRGADQPTWVCLYDIYGDAPFKPGQMAGPLCENCDMYKPAYQD